MEESVAVVMSTLNEESSIDRALDAIESQTAGVRILVIDGGSNDTTVDRLQWRAARNPRLRVYADGVRRSLPEALNAAVAEIDEAFVAKVDARTFIAPDFIERALRIFEREGPQVACVGGRPEQYGETNFGQGVAYARMSPFGVGGSGYADARTYADVDTVQCGVYRRSALLEVGGFDPALQFGEDEELNWRLRKAGYRIARDTNVRFRYVARSTWLGALAQYRNYGRARARVLAKHPDFVRLRHLVPTAVLLGGAALIAAAPFSRRARMLLGVVALGYGAAAAAAACTAARRDLRHAPATALAFTALHLGYGMGLLEGLRARRTRRHDVPKKVAHLTSVHDPGDSRITVKECATLLESGYNVVLVAPGALRNAPLGLAFRSLPVPKNRFDRLTRTVWNVYHEALKEKADVYHFHDPELMFVGLALRLTGARVIFDVHEDIPADIVDKPWIAPALRRPIAAVSAAVLRAFNRFFSAIVAATPAIARGLAHDRLAVVNNYPRADEFADVVDADFSNRPASVLYLGSITLIRCIDRLVGALAHPEMGNGIRLTLIGRFEDGRLEQRISAMPGWNRVDYLGWRSRLEVQSIVGNVRAGVILFRSGPNIDDALPTKLFEYMAAGLPVVVSSTLQCSSLVVDAGCGVAVDPYDEAAVARAISDLVSNPSLAQAMGARGRRLVLEHYLWESEGRRLTKLYAEIA